MPLLGLLALHGAAVSRVHRINKNQISLIEQRILVISQLKWRRRQISVFLHYHSTWTQHAQMQPHRCRARATVKRKRQRTFGSIPDPVFYVSDKKDLGARLFALCFL